MSNYQSLSGRTKGLILLIILFLLMLLLSCKNEKERIRELTDEEIVNILEEARKPVQ